MNEPTPTRLPDTRMPPGAECAVEALAEAHLARLRAGEAPDRQALVAAHPELGAWLDRRLALVEMLHRAGQLTRGAGPEPAAACPPPVIPEYELLGEVGRGGMGVVYKARDLRLNRLVALKMILAGAHAGPQQVARFHLEAEALASLQHPHIVQVYEVGAHDRCPYLALEYVAGGSLDRHLAGKPQPPRAAAALVETLARAMHAAHLRGIVHRDLKPGNVLLQGVGSGEWGVGGRGGEGPAPLLPTPHSLPPVPKITDFGLAKRLGEDRPQTRAGAVLGTPSYMAPEQAAGRAHEVGPAADVWALGAILYEALTGGPPFLGDSDLTTLQQVRSQEPVPPTRLQARVPRDLETICLKCLHKEPAKRYATAEALADDLRRFLAGEPVRARPVGRWERLRKWVKRRPAHAALVAVSGLAVLSLAAGGLWYNARVHAERDRAEHNLQQALRAVDEMLTEVGDEQLAAEPRMEEKRRVLLEKALRFYKEFLRERGDDPRLRKETARAYRRMADVLRLLARYAEAEEAYREAAALFTPLLAGRPGDADLRQALADCHNWRGEVLRETSRHQEARAAYQEAERLQERLVAEFPDKPAYQRDLARTLYNRGISAHDAGRPADAERDLGRAIDLLEELVRRHAEDDGYRQHLARGRLNLGRVLAALQRPHDAEAAYDQAAALLTKLTRKDPDQPDYRHGLAVVHNNLGNLFAAQDLDRARAVHQKALGLFRDLAADFPRVPKYRRELANTHNSLGRVRADMKDLPGARQEWDEARALLFRLTVERPAVPDYQADLGLALGNLGWLLTEQKDLPGARRHLDEAVGYLKAALRPNPNHPDYRRALGNQYQSLAETLINLGEHAAAADAALELAKGWRDAGQDRYFAACFLARCASRAGAAAAARTYADLAVRQLREAARAGFPVAERLRQDRQTIFSALEGRADFRDLAAAE